MARDDFESESRSRLAPSILNADLTELGSILQLLEHSRVDFIHLDIMDGHFVPNISIGIPVVQSVRKRTSLPLDVHLMIDQPERYIDAFAEAGADILTVHPEATPHIHRALQMIRNNGKRAGVALNPGTPISQAIELLPYVELVLIMSVNPGFGGQEFIPESLDRVRQVRHAVDEGEFQTMIEIDGGINFDTAPRAVAAGADTLVAGSTIFGHDEGPEAAIQRLREVAG